jgi:hypothetical protein
MRIAFYTFLISLLAFRGQAQFFFHSYGDSSHEQNRIHLTTPAGHYLFNFEVNPVPFGMEEIIHTNFSGDSIESWLLPPSFASFFHPVAALTGNRFITCNSTFDINTGVDSIIMTWYDSTFQQISSVILTDTTYINIERILITSDNNILIGGDDSPINAPFITHSRLIKMDSTGNVLFDLSLNPVSYVYQSVRGMIESTDHYYIVATEVTSGSNAASSKMIYKIDPSGNLIWNEYTSGYYAGSPNQISEGTAGYLFTGNTAPNNHSSGSCRLTMLDTSGATVWTKVLSNFYGNQAIIVGNSIYACGHVSTAPYPYISDLAVMKMNDAGDSLLTFTLQLPKNEVATNISFSNNMLVVSGTIDDTLNSYHGDSFLIGLDTILNYTFIPDQFPDHNGLILYSNPSDGNFSIQVDATISANAALEIFNSIGEKIYSKHFLELTSMTPITIGSEHFPKGIYLVVLSDINKNFFQKLIIR